MIQITPQMRVLVAVEATDFRRGIDGLAQLCRAGLGADSFTGTVFVFRNKRRTAVKLLVYDGQGFWLCHKRLEKGRFVAPWQVDQDEPLRWTMSELALFLEGSEFVGRMRLSPPTWSPAERVVEFV